MTISSANGVTRRGFLKLSALAGLACGVAGAGLTGCSSSGATSGGIGRARAAG